MNTTTTTLNPLEPVVEPPRVPWGVRDLLWAILTAAVGILLLNLAILLLSYWLNMPIRDDSVLLMLVVIVQDLIIIGAAWAFSILRYRVGWAQLGWRTFNVAFGCLLSAALFGLSYFIRICYVITAMALGWQLQPQDIITRLNVSGWGLLLTFFSAAILAPIAEEIFFRGFLYAGLRARIGVLGAMVTSTLFFTALHFSLDAFIPIFILGLCLAFLYEKTGSLYPSIILHASNNGIAIIALAIVQMMGWKI
jgi:membrane protease YdiL (CAAX protease family)